MRLSDLQNKTIVSSSDGKNIGNIIDVNIDPNNGNILSFVIEPNRNFFRFFRIDKTDIEIYWDKIEKIGEDVILVKNK